jgi:hypothetical protein
MGSRRSGLPPEDFFRISIVLACSPASLRSRLSPSRSAASSPLLAATDAPRQPAESSNSCPVPGDLGTVRPEEVGERDRVPLELLRVPLRVVASRLALLPLGSHDPSLQVSTIRGKLQPDLPPPGEATVMWRRGPVTRSRTTAPERLPWGACREVTSPGNRRPAPAKAGSVAARWPDAFGRCNTR